jgi:integrase
MLQVMDLAEAASGSTGGYLESWLSHTRGRVRPRTLRGYEGLIRLYALPALGEVPLERLRPLHLQTVYAELLGRGLSGGTVLNLHLVLTQALSQVVRWELLRVSPASGAQPPRPRRPEPRVVDPALASRILEAVRGTALELPATFALATGMRRGEILALRWRDLDGAYTVAQVRRSLQVTAEGLTFEEPKTRRSRRAVALPGMLRPYLVSHRADQARRRSACPDWSDLDLLIDEGDGSPLHPDTLSSGWFRFLKSSGLPHVRFHDLRHGHATLLLMAGTHPKVVSERLGHASIATTFDIYSHVIPSMQTEAAAAFDGLFSS